MRTNTRIRPQDVLTVYNGAEGRLWELIMGEQIHIGGLTSSLELARAASIECGSQGIDLCCCTGAGMRFLLRFVSVKAMRGVDMCPTMIDLGRQRCREQGWDGRIDFVQAEATDTGLPAGQADFIWGEDAWCYVPDKRRLVAEAARLVRPGGTIAFTDWVEGPQPLTASEAERFMTFMKFPSLATVADYQALLEEQHGMVVTATDTGRFAPYVALYIDMLQRQLTTDALALVGYDTKVMEMLAGEMAFTLQLAQAGKLSQAMVVARKGP
jgi:SAM-dependent methyltransferase